MRFVLLYFTLTSSSMWFMIMDALDDNSFGSGADEDVDIEGEFQVSKEWEWEDIHDTCIRELNIKLNLVLFWFDFYLLLLA